jgi:hypothetical protein
MNEEPVTIVLESALGCMALLQLSKMHLLSHDAPIPIEQLTQLTNLHPVANITPVNPGSEPEFKHE